MSAHTPGPWHFDGFDILGPNGEDIGYVNESDGADDPVEYPAEANALLIAAAPDLLECCKELRVALAAAMRVVTDLDAMRQIGAEAGTYQQRFVDEMRVSGVRDGIGVRAEDALAKAEGR